MEQSADAVQSVFPDFKSHPSVKSRDCQQAGQGEWEFGQFKGGAPNGGRPMLMLNCDDLQQKRSFESCADYCGSDFTVGKSSVAFGFHSSLLT